MNAARFPNGLEMRAAPDVRADGRQLVGYAAVFNSPAVIGGYTETIKPGAFLASLATPGRDVIALADHDPAKLLGRQSSGTLRLAEDARGLAFTLDLPDTSTGADVLALAKRSDLGGMSFGFRVTQEAWPTLDSRTLLAVELVEISVIQAWPAYSQTSVQARARQPGQIARARRLAILGIV